MKDFHPAQGAFDGSTAKRGRIDRPAIIRAALALGLENVTMTAVAAQLNVSVAALYRHVKDLDELLGLCARTQISALLTPIDIGQHWSALVREYASLLYDTFQGQTGLLLEYLNGGAPPQTEVDTLESFIKAMYSRGFTPRAAYRLANDMRAVALGGAVVSTAMAAVVRACGNADVAVDAALNGGGTDDLTLVKSVASEYRQFVDDPNWEDTLDLLLSAVAEQRGEKLPV